MTKISIFDSNLSIIKKDTLTTGSGSSFKIKFSFNEETWAEYPERYAVFYQVITEPKLEMQISEDNTVEIPNRLLTVDLPLFIGVYGTKEDGTLLCTNFKSIPVMYGAFSGTIESYSNQLSTLVRSLDTKIRFIRINEKGEFQYTTDGENWISITASDTDGDKIFTGNITFDKPVTFNSQYVYYKTASGDNSLILPDGVQNETIATREWVSENAGEAITVDDSLSTESTNPVQNKVIAEAINSLSGKIDNLTSFKFEIVETLPTTGESNIIYLIAKSQSESGNVYEEYLYVGSSYEKIGETTVDLSNYYNKGEVDNLLENVGKNQITLTVDYYDFEYILAGDIPLRISSATYSSLLSGVDEVIITDDGSHKIVFTNTGEVRAMVGVSTPFYKGQYSTPPISGGITDTTFYGLELISSAGSYSVKVVTLEITNPVSAGGSDITVDTALSTTSTNPVQNKVITEELNKKSTFSGNYNDLSNKPTIPEALADLTDDATHRTVTDDEKTAWNAKSTFSGSYNDLTDKPTLSTVATSGNYNDLTNKPTIPTVPTNVSAFTNDAGYLTEHQDISNKADLVDGKVPSTQLPSYVDDVVEYASFGSLPTTGEAGKIYVTTDTNKIYRWSGSAYIEIVDVPDLTNYYTKTEVDNLLENVEIAVDTELSETSTNPVENKAVTAEFNKRIPEVPEATVEYAKVGDTPGETIYFDTSLNLDEFLSTLQVEEGESVVLYGLGENAFIVASTLSSFGYEGTDGKPAWAIANRAAINVDDLNNGYIYYSNNTPDEAISELSELLGFTLQKGWNVSEYTQPLMQAFTITTIPTVGFVSLAPITNVNKILVGNPADKTVSWQDMPESEGGTSITGATAGTSTEADGYTVTPITFTLSDETTLAVDIKAKNGADGADGTNGTNGTNGTDGADGVSVTGVTEGTATESDGYTVTPLTFTFSDNTTKEVSVKAKNGADGADGADIEIIELSVTESGDSATFSASFTQFEKFKNKTANLRLKFSVLDAGDYVDFVCTQYYQTGTTQGLIFSSTAGVFDEENTTASHVFIAKLAGNPSYGVTPSGTVKKYNLEETGGSDIVVDTELSETSANPVQNKVITEELNKKVSLTGDQTIAGSKTFTNQVSLTGGAFMPSGRGLTWGRLALTGSEYGMTESKTLTLPQSSGTLATQEWVKENAGGSETELGIEYVDIEVDLSTTTTITDAEAASKLTNGSLAAYPNRAIRIRSGTADSYYAEYVCYYTCAILLPFNLAFYYQSLANTLDAVGVVTQMTVRLDGDTFTFMPPVSPALQGTSGTIPTEMLDVMTDKNGLLWVDDEFNIQVFSPIMGAYGGVMQLYSSVGKNADGEPVIRYISIDTDTLEWALTEQVVGGGGDIDTSNLVDLDSEQTITGKKTFNQAVQTPIGFTVDGANGFGTYYEDRLQLLHTDGNTYDYTYPTESGTLATQEWVTENAGSDIDISNLVDLDSAQTITAQKTFTNRVTLQDGANVASDKGFLWGGMLALKGSATGMTETKTLTLPQETGTLATQKWVEENTLTQEWVEENTASIDTQTVEYLSSSNIMSILTSSMMYVDTIPSGYTKKYSLPLYTYGDFNTLFDNSANTVVELKAYMRVGNYDKGKPIASCKFSGLKNQYTLGTAKSETASNTDYFYPAMFVVNGVDQEIIICFDEKATSKVTWSTTEVDDSGQITGTHTITFVLNKYKVS